MPPRKRKGLFGTKPKPVTKVTGSATKTYGKKSPTKESKNKNSKGDATNWEEPQPARRASGRVEPPSTSKSSSKSPVKPKSKSSQALKDSLKRAREEREEESHDEDDDDDEDLPEYTVKEMEKIVAQLGSEKTSTRFSSAEVNNNNDNGTAQSIKVAAGVLVRINTGSPEKEGWLVEVMEIRGLKNETRPHEADGVEQLTESGKVVTSCDVVWIKMAWFYKQQDFKILKQPQLYPEAVLKSLGARELVRTDHSDWNSSELILPNLETERLFVFEDYYPALDLQHPLGRPVPSIKKTKSKAVALPLPLPFYFFGDDSTVKSLPDLPEEDATRHRGSRRNFDGVSYYRTSYSFPNSLLKDQKKKQKVEIIQKTAGPLSLALHSTSKTPYNPSEIQHYSPLEEIWYSVAQLRKGKHYHNLPLAENQRFTALELHLDGDDGEEDDYRQNNLKLAQACIVRGSYYGLIGNSYLVTRARILLKEEQSDGNSSFEHDGEMTEEESARKEEMEALHEAWLEWKEQMEARRTIAVKKLGTDSDRLGLPAGQAWCCPKSDPKQQI